MTNPFKEPMQDGKPELHGPINEGDSTGGLIPYKNPHALIGYYLSIFGMFPCIGIVLSIPAFILGIIGLQKRRQQPEIRGQVHAWIAIVLGGSFSLFHAAGIVMIIISVAAGA